MRTMWAIWFIGAAGMAPVGAVGTTPLQPGWVSAEAEWLVHLDVEAWNASKIGRFVTDHAEALDLDIDELDDFQRQTGLDPRTDIFGVTVYGWVADGAERMVIVAVTTDRADAALERIRESGESRTLLIDGHEVHTVPADGDTILVHVRPDARFDRRLVVMSQDQAALQAGLAVIEQRAPSLTIGRKPALTGPHPGSILFMAASRLEALDIEPASEVLRLSDACVIDVGEHEGLFGAYATASADNAEDASNITQVVEGMLALGRLLMARDGELAPVRALIDGVDVAADGTRVTVGFRHDVQALIDVAGPLLQEEH